MRGLQEKFKKDVAFRNLIRNTEKMTDKNFADILKKDEEWFQKMNNESKTSLKHIKRVN